MALLANEAWRRRNDPASVPFVALTLLVSVWSLGNAIELLAGDETTAFFWVRIEYIAIVLVPVAWLVMMLAFAERQHVLRRARLLALMIIPAITISIIWSPRAIPLFWRIFEIEQITPLTIIRVERGSWFWVHTAYSYIMLLTGTLILFRSLRNTAGLYRNQSWAILVGITTPWLVNIIYIAGLIPKEFPDPTAISFVISSLFFSWAMRDAGLFDLGPLAYHEVFQQMYDGVLVLDPKNRVVDLNQAAAQTLGNPAQTFIGRTLSDILVHQPTLIAHYQDLMTSDRPIHTEIAVHTADQLSVYDIQMTPLHGKRGTLGRMLVWRNITTLKQAMMQIEEQNKVLENQAIALQDAKAAAEAGSQAKSLFLAAMSHELRTPLSAILGYTELIEYDLAEENIPALENDLNNIKIAGQHLLNMIGGILDYAKIEAGKMKIEPETFRIQTIINEALTAVRPMLERNANRVELDLPADSVTMHADLVKVRQVLINLLANAAKFTQAGVITLRVRSTTNSSQRMNVVFEISDTGVGMSKQQMGQLFQEFNQVIAGPTGQVGSGLGLAISQKLCNLMGGNISVVSNPGQGTTFTIILPMSC